MIIYKTTNIVNEKIYVGQDVHNNPNYLGSGLLLVRAIKKYGKENFKKEAIDVAESLEVLNEKEIYWVKFCNCKVPNGYNLTDGGEGVVGYVWTEEDKNKARDRSLGELNVAKRPEVRKKMREAKLGEKNPMKDPECSGKRKGENNPSKKLEVRKKMSNSLKGRFISEETRKKMSLAKRGKPQTEEVKKKIGESKKGKKREPFSEEWRRNLSKSRKKGKT